MKDTRTCIKGLLRDIFPLWKEILLSCLIGLLKIAGSLAFVWISKTLVDIATGTLALPLMPYVWVMAGVSVLMVATMVGGRWWENYFTLVVCNRMREETFGRVMASRWNGREAFHSADTVNRLEDDIAVVADLACSRVPDTLVTLCQLVAACVFLFSMQPGLMWVLLIIMPVAVVGSRMFFKTIRSLTAHLRAKDSEVQLLMQESLQNRIVIKTLGYTEGVMTKLGWLQEDIRSNTVKRLNYNAVARSFMAFGFRAGYVAAFLWGVFGIRDGVVTYGMMTAFLQLVGQIQMPVANIAQHIPAFIHSLTSVERLMELDELPPATADGKPGSCADECLLPGAPGIRIENVSFRYPDEPDESRFIFHDFSWDFKPGKVSVIIGVTGAGKSTLTKMLLGLLRPVSGRIMLYSGDREIEAGENAMRNFMYVPQGGSLLSGTIRENLLMARPDATEEQLREALEIAVADFVYDLPAGLDTVCTEKGSGLSEGQAQRIAIARAILHDGGIIILDEATSALDSDTENRLLENLDKYFAGGRTVIWITHRESVTRSAASVLKVSQN